MFIVLDKRKNKREREREKQRHQLHRFYRTQKILNKECYELGLKYHYYLFIYLFIYMVKLYLKIGVVIIIIILFFFFFLLSIVTYVLGKKKDLVDTKTIEETLN